MLVLGAALVSIAGPAAAQRHPAAQPFTGYELALRGSQEVRVGRDNRFRGTAYRVRGLAELVPYEGPVRVRFTRVIVDDNDETQAAEVDANDWVTAIVGADGDFVADVPVPPRVIRRGQPRLVVQVGPPDAAREFEIPVSERAAVEVMLRTDRVLYEAGETAHVWALLTDAQSHRPLAGERMRFAIGGGVDDPFSPRTDAVVTSAAGVAHLEVPIPEGLREGTVQVRLEVPGQTRRTLAFRVGTRVWERMMATVTVSPDQVAPSGTARAEVRVTTPSGAPVADAQVTGHLEGRDAPYTGQTGADGRLVYEVRAPAFLSHETGVLSLRVEARHGAHGSASAAAQLRLAVPLALQIEVFPPLGGLVPEVDEPLYVRLRDGAGNPPPAGTEVRVEGPVIPRGVAMATTDENGLAVVTARAPLGAASAAFSTQPVASVVVTALGPVERVARMSVPVLRDAAISLSLERVVAEPGEVVTVRLGRRPGARRRAAIVELLDPAGRSITSQRVSAGTSRVRMTMPTDLLGLLAVRVRPVDEDESLTSIGVIERLIVRPARPDFVAVESERRRWVVGETAQVRLRTLPTGPNGPKSFAAVLVRDLSAHSGERAFQRNFLAGAFSRAILDPASEGADVLARAVLAADPLLDPAPFVVAPLVDALAMPDESGSEGSALPRGDLRDPYPMSRELSRRGVAQAMRAIEENLVVALDDDAVDEVTIGRGASRRFRADLLGGQDPDDPDQSDAVNASGDAEFLTLGGEPITPALLEAADPSFRFETVARRVARARLVRLWVALAHYLDPGDEATPAERRAAEEPSERWLPRMVGAGLIEQHELADPWGGHFVLHTTRSPVLVVSARATNLELVSPGPDGRVGTRDDVRDPFARAVPLATPYAVASGEDELMRRLAVLSPLEATLEALRESYQRRTVEMAEEEIGDAVFGAASEGRYGAGGIGLLGVGSGGGGGSGYGSGRGGMSGRRARAPQVRMGRASINGLSGVLRERFPPTLLFVPSLELDASGTTTVPIALADTVTTYLVEAIVWREDGWVWSDRTEIEVDRDIVVAAPIPGTAHRGDTLRLPLRVSNRGTTPRRINLMLLGDRGLGIADSEVHSLRLAPGGSAQVPIDVSLDRAGEGTLTVVATSPEGEAIDAVRRPLRVLPLSRRAEARADMLGDGRGSVSLAIPPGAHGLRGGLRVVAGDALFAPLDPLSPWSRWAPTRSIRTTPGGPSNAHGGVQQALLRAMNLAAHYLDRGVDTEHVAQEASSLASFVERQLLAGDHSVETEGRRTRLLASVVLGLAPVARHLGQRPRGAGVGPLLERLREDLAGRAIGTSDDPALWIVAAGALGWSDDGEGPGLVGELVRRVRRHVIVVGEDRWLAAEGARPMRSTLLLAMAELSLGNRQVALDYLATVGRWSLAGRPGHSLPEDERALVRALLRRLRRGGTPRQVTVRIDGEERRHRLVMGVADIVAPALASPGRHTVTVEVPGGAPVWVEASARYGVSWRMRPRRTGPVAVAIEGTPGLVDEVTALEIVVRNRTPRVVPRTVVEVELPTGAEVLAADLRRLARRGLSADQGGGVLRLVLPPLSPGQERRLPLSLRFSVEGTFLGFGVAAWAEDRPGWVTVVRPRRMVLRREAP